MSKLFKCPLREDKVCMGNDCKFWNEDAKDCVINAGLTALMSLFIEISENKRLKKEKKRGIMDKIIRMAERATEEAFKSEEEKG